MVTKKEVGNEKKSRSRKVKEIHIEIIPNECQTKAIELIELFGLTEPPVFERVIKREFEVEE